MELRRSDIVIPMQRMRKLEGLAPAASVCTAGLAVGELCVLLDIRSGAIDGVSIAV